MSASSSSNIAECVAAASSLHEHQNVTKSSIGSAMANRFRRRPTSLHIPIPMQGSGTNNTNPSKIIKTSSNEPRDDASTGGGGGDCSSSSSISSIPSSSKAVAAALAGLTPSSSWYNSNGSDSECQSSLRTASRCDSQPLGRVSLSPSPCFGRRSAAILSPLLNAATRAIGSDMEVFQLTTVNPVKSSTTSMYYSSDLNLNIQIGDQDEIELVGRKGLVGQHTHLPRSHQLQQNTNNFNRHTRHDSISHNHMHSHLSSSKGFYNYYLAHHKHRFKFLKHLYDDPQILSSMLSKIFYSI